MSLFCAQRVLGANTPKSYAFAVTAPDGQPTMATLQIFECRSAPLVPPSSVDGIDVNINPLSSMLDFVSGTIETFHLGLLVIDGADMEHWVISSWDIGEAYDGAYIGVVRGSEYMQFRPGNSAIDMLSSDGNGNIATSSYADAVRCIND